MTDKKISAHESIVGVMAAVKAVGKDDRNTQQNFNYRGIDAVVNAVHPALVKVGGFITGSQLSQTVEHGTSRNGGQITMVRLEVAYSWYGTDGGDPIRSVVSSEAFDTADKATAKAWSVAYRTYLLQTLMLPTTDPDPDSEYIEKGAVQQSGPPANWRAMVAEAVSVDALTKIWSDANAGGWLTEDVLSALSARKEKVNAFADATKTE